MGTNTVSQSRCLTGGAYCLCCLSFAGTRWGTCLLNWLLSKSSPLSLPPTAWLPKSSLFGTLWLVVSAVWRFTYSWFSVLVSVQPPTPNWHTSDSCEFWLFEGPFPHCPHKKLAWWLRPISRPQTRNSNTAVNFVLKASWMPALLPASSLGAKKNVFYKCILYVRTAPRRRRDRGDASVCLHLDQRRMPRRKCTH